MNSQEQVLEPVDNGSPFDAGRALHSLVRRCTTCKRVKETLDALYHAIGKRVTLSAKGSNIDKGHQVESQVDNVEYLETHCPDCFGTGLQLTEHGRHVLGLIALYLPHANPKWLGSRDEIPF